MLGLSEVAQGLLSGVAAFEGVVNGVLDFANGVLSAAETFTNGKYVWENQRFAPADGIGCSYISNDISFIPRPFQSLKKNYLLEFRSSQISDFNSKDSCF